MDEKIFALATAHLDTQWKWTVRKTIEEYLPDTLKKNFHLMGTYSNYIFNFEGAFRYQLIKEYYPLEYKVLKEAILQGRWNVSGSMWDSIDLHIPFAETIQRAILYGNRFFKEEFNRQSEDIFLPDCFGFPISLPTIAAHMELKCISTQKLAWNGAMGKELPFSVGKWVGLDGSFLYAALNPGIYETQFKESLSASEKYTQIAKKDSIAVVYYGTGDIGGAPDEESIKIVHEDVIKGPDATTGVHTISSKSDGFYRDLMTKEVPVYQGELLLKKHGVGCYTSRAIQKRWFKQCEKLALVAEKINAIAFSLGYEYPHNNIDTAWKRFLWHGFHDDVTGTSIPEAYKISENDYLITLGQLTEEIVGGMRNISNNLDTSKLGIPLLVFNPIETTRFGVMEVVVPEGDFHVVNDEGEVVPHQKVEGKLLFFDRLPSVGVKVFYLYPGKKEQTTELSYHHEVDHVLENRYYIVRINEQGNISSIIDKEFNRELLRNPLHYEFFDNNSETWPSWEINYEDIQKAREILESTPEVELMEDGPVRISIQITRKQAGSSFIETVSLMKDVKRVEVDLRIDWYTPETLLKLAFPLLLPAENATYDVGTGVVERGTNTDGRYEVPSGKFVDVCDGNFGVSIFSEDKIGWDRPEKELIRLSLIHTPKGSFEEHAQHLQDIGKHHTRFAIYSHPSNYKRSTVLASEEFHYPPMTFFSERHSGELGTTLRFLDVEDVNIRVEAIKKAQESEGIVVRVQEMAGEDHEEARIKFYTRVLNVQEISGMEKLVSAKSLIQGSSIAFPIGAFERKSFLVRLREPNVPPVPLKQKEISLVYNSNLYSPEGSNKITKQIPIEITPEVVSQRGVNYKLYPERLYTVMKASGQKIIMPEGYDQLYFLAASLDGDQDFIFEVDGTKRKIRISDFYEDIGSWDDYAREDFASMKTDPICWHATHLHAPEGNLAYQYGYMFRYTLRGRKIRFPVNDNLVIFAATAVQGYEVENAHPFFEYIQDFERYTLQVSGERERQIPVGTKLSFVIGTEDFEPYYEFMPSENIFVERKSNA